MKALKKIIWMKNSLKNLKEFPEEVQDSVGYALQMVQEGRTPRNGKTLKGFNPAVMEIISNHDNDTFRSVYTVKISEIVYVLHCFQKKSKQGIKTPKQEIDLIKQRLREAELIDKSKGE